MKSSSAFAAVSLVWMAHWGATSVPNYDFALFRRPPTDERDMDAILSVNNITVQWFAGRSRPLRIIAMGWRRLSIRLLCDFHQPLQGKSKLQNMEFHVEYRDGAFKRQSKKILLKQDGHHSLPLIGDLAVDIFYNSSTGAAGFIIAEIYQPSLDQFTFRCCARNNRSHLTVNSNFMEIVDYRHKFPDNVVNKTIRHPININHRRLFNCTDRPLESKDRLAILYEWRLCNSEEVDECAEERLITEVEQSLTWPVHVMLNGSLMWSFVPSDMVETLQGMSLLCYINGIHVAIYNNLTFINTSPSSNKKVDDLVMMEPKGHNKVRLFDSTSFNTTLPCVFSAGRGKLNSSWTFIDLKGGETALRDGAFDFDRRVIARGNLLTFQGPFTRATPGNYRCTVRWTPRSSGQAKIKNGTYVISLYGYPRFENTTWGPRVVKVVDGANERIKCSFFPHSWMDVTCGITAPSGRGRQFIAELPGVMKLKDGTALPYTYSEITHYTALDVKDKRNLTSSYLIQCWGLNGRTEKRIYQQIIILVTQPRIIFARNMSDFKCTDCPCFRKSFTCKLKNIGELKKAHFTIETKWLLITSENISKTLNETGAVVHLGESMIEKIRMNSSSMRCIVTVSGGNQTIIQKKMEAPLVIPCNEMEDVDNGTLLVDITSRNVEDATDNFSKTTTVTNTNSGISIRQLLDASIEPFINSGPSTPKGKFGKTTTSRSIAATAMKGNVNKIITDTATQYEIIKKTPSTTSEDTATTKPTVTNKNSGISTWQTVIVATQSFTNSGPSNINRKSDVTTTNRSIAATVIKGIVNATFTDTAAMSKIATTTPSTVSQSTIKVTAKPTIINTDPGTSAGQLVKVSTHSFKNSRLSNTNRKKYVTTRNTSMAATTAKQIVNVTITNTKFVSESTSFTPSKTTANATLMTLTIVNTISDKVEILSETNGTKQSTNSTTNTTTKTNVQTSFWIPPWAFVLFMFFIFSISVLVVSFCYA